MRTSVAGFIAFCLLGSIPFSSPADTAESVEQHGIRITFAGPHEVGRFANGDWWVLADVNGKVAITAMTPAFDGRHNGWEVNPSDTNKQGFDTRISAFDAALVPALPYDASAGASIVKTVGVDTSASKVTAPLLKAMVLTVLAEAPPDRGATVFRPPYFGVDKPLYRTTDLHPEHLPSERADGIDNVPSLDWVENAFQRVQLDHKRGWSGRSMHPKEHMPDYGSGVCARIGAGALRLMLDDPPAEKLPALISYVQMGIDMYHMQLGGLTYGADGGHNHGRKLPVALAGMVLENEEMKEWVRSRAGKIYHEDLSVYYSPVANMVLWGQGNQGPGAYWRTLCDKKGAKTISDPYGYIDGGIDPGGSYQYCCNSSTWKGTVLCLHLSPALREIWNYEPIIDYEDRWMNFGAWTQPDPYAPTDCDQRGKLDDDPSDGIGRWPSRHGASKGGGAWGHGFADAMWKVKRPGNAAGFPAITPYGGTLDAPVPVILESSPRTPGCRLHYTLDGSAPTEESPLYSEPLEFIGDTILKVRAFKDGLYPSAVHAVRFHIQSSKKDAP